MWLFGKKKKEKAQEPEKQTPNEQKSTKPVEKKAAVKNTREEAERSKKVATKAKSTKTEKVAKPAKVEKVEKPAKSGRDPKTEKSEKVAVIEKSKKTAKSEKVAPEKVSKTEKNEKKAVYRVLFDKSSRMWLIKKDGAKRTIASFVTKEEALNRVKELSATKDLSFVVHKKDGKFQKKQ